MEWSNTTRRWIVATAVGLLTPFAFSEYALRVLRLREYPIHPGTIDDPILVVFVGLAFVEIGVLVVAGWLNGLRVAAIITIGGMLMWPWFFLSLPTHTYAGAGYSFFLFAIVVIAFCFEAVARYHESVERILRTENGQLAVALGTLHFAVAIALTVYTRGFYLFTGPDFLIVVPSAACLLILGAVPVVLLKRRGLVSPVLVVVGWLGWGLYGIWQMRDAFPLGQFSGIDFAGIQPYPDYLFSWVPLAIVLLLVITSEIGLRNIRSEYVN